MAYAHNLAKEIDVFQTWIKEIEDKPEINSAEEAYAALRAVLQSLRDRLPVGEAVHLSAQLPLIARGIYFEGWKPSKVPESYDLQQFFDKIRTHLNGKCARADPGLLAGHVFEVMANHISRGELKHVHDGLPKDLQKLLGGKIAA